MCVWDVKMIFIKLMGHIIIELDLSVLQKTSTTLVALYYLCRYIPCDMDSQWLIFIMQVSTTVLIVSLSYQPFIYLNNNRITKT